MKSISKNKLVKLISICGQIAEHKAEKIQEHSMNEEQLIEALDKNEQEILKELLLKLKVKWLSDHKQAMKFKKISNNKS